jgi:hypothetical protein
MEGRISLAEFCCFFLQKRRMGRHTMLRKCSNPSCSVPFRSLREGKLFLAEPRPQDPDDGLRKKLPRREHFWLCQACSGHFTLRFDSDRGMLTVPLHQDQEQGWEAVLA